MGRHGPGNDDVPPRRRAPAPGGPDGDPGDHVRATADDVWPWLAQLGQGRGGFYSYHFLENLVGCDIHSADRILREWQCLDGGGEVKLHPEVLLIVAQLQPGRALVLRGGVPMGRTPPPYDFPRAFVLRGDPDAATRLVVRERYAYSRRWAPLLVEPVELISFVMSQRMLRGIRDRAERQPRARSRAIGGDGPVADLISRGTPG